MSTPPAPSTPTAATAAHSTSAETPVCGSPGGVLVGEPGEVVGGWLG